ncbi:serine/threonine-protein phosphatase 1 regulatory subunit 10-like [Chelonus insularis]|uniref:serine/threonine-protein phosphatase 1 regulatory subunit 10-like n=1 Tax=Chelonus insularis TaxID=460826 RepID=UPI00158ECB52|nr:serine/threonine-protein phosphatase 1 regulatory subunit 10-like [Chelonus insularis]XP_034951044.1 serine/threonine-protein phosphatase 1 regulatory subunit 10-like [Chelonus insularis]XP_034951045.1 serine/threonine-protein phosphatase 1 regulatory subunit 10-like [Chelonus insularis]XP_034951047.1 serine/threonine-protein phosphatase 1 regulatory subunit 10-like [Chelonus insularis]
MPRIDPLSLLKCLSVLLGSTGGIKSKEEVHRLANLMTKFSKKLVSKCIYIQILKSTSAELLNQFMSDGGWNLIHMWLTDGIVAKNWALIQELLELLLLCPVDIDRLKSNNCPKLIKGLSKEGSHQNVRLLASRLVEQWLKIVKGEAAPNSVPMQITIANQPTSARFVAVKTDQKDMVESSTVKVQDLNINANSVVRDTTIQHPIVQQVQPIQDQIHIQPVQVQIVNTTLPGQLKPTQIKKQSYVVVSNPSSQNQTAVPVYKITIRDGDQILTKVETDPSNIFNDSANNVVLNGEIKKDVFGKQDNDDISSTENCQSYNNGVSDNVESEVKQESNCNDETENVVKSIKDETDSTIDNTVNSENKSSDKENRESQKKDEKSSNSSDKKSSHQSSSKSTSKHSSGSSSRSSSSSRKSSSHRSSSSSKSSSSSSKSSKDKHHSSKHSSSSSKSKSDKEKEREKEKEKQKKDQAEKDKATLEKVQGQSLGSKFGKIPKKKAEDEKSTDSVRKSSTESRESSKENKDKSDSKDKKSSISPTILEKKNISISIENRKNSQDSTRPKTVKTFNSKFRSTGLEEEVKPPPPRTASKKTSSTADKKIIPPKIPSLKRPSPIRESGASADKKAKLSLDPPVIVSDDKKGGIKIIPPKPKPMVLQESDMFMDALTASTKNKEPRKRKRRTSVSKDGSTEAKKSEGANSVSGDHTARDSTPPPSSPQNTDERSLSVKPEFKFYQDTLETDEDKEDKDRQDDKDVEMDEDKLKERGINDDEERSRTPTNEDEVEDMKGPASPDDPEDTGRKESDLQSEIRYVDGLRSVLLLQKRRGPKKNLKWKTELESVRYFELDETERVNVTKTFTDMKQMEKQNEREAFQMARKLSTEDLMEERTRWKVLIPIDLPPPLVEPGKDSKEKDIQYAREKGILQALYFNRSMIPDSAAEPDEERHHVITDPKIIPLDDLTGNKESEKDFTSVAWPEPKPQLASVAPVVSNVHFPSFAPHNQSMPTMQMQSNPIGSMNPMPQQMNQTMMPPMNHMAGSVQDMNTGAGGWRTGDGKVVVPDVQMNNMNNMPNMTGNLPPGFPPPGMENPMMPNMMPPPPGMFNQQDGYPNIMGEDGSYGHMPNNFQGPGMFGPGPNFQNGPNIPRGMGPMHGANRGRGGPGWFRGGGGVIGGGGGGVGPMRGGWVGRGGWRGNGKQPPVCRQFSKNGYCRVGDKCQYLHPGVNCPPF